MTSRLTQKRENSLKLEKYPRGKNPKSLKNLKPYPKGVSGNEGSGNGYSLTSELKHALNKETRAKLIQSTIEGAIKRESVPFREVWDRTEGKVTQPIESTPDMVQTVVFILPDGTRLGSKQLSTLKEIPQHIESGETEGEE